MDEHSTSEIRMIATDVVDQQAKVCERRMQNIEGKIDGLAKDLDEFKTDIKSDIKGMRADARADNLQLRLDLKAVEQQSIRLDGRWKIFTVIAALLGAIGVVLGILDSIKMLLGG